MFIYLADLGNHCDPSYGKLKTQDLPPSGYTQPDPTDLEQLASAILKALPKQ